MAANDKGIILTFNADAVAAINILARKLNILCAHSNKNCAQILKRIFLAAKDGSYTEAKVVSASVSTNIVLMNLEGFENREEVQGMKNTVLYLKREDIPLKKGSYLLADIIGLPVIDADNGTKYGTVKDITDSVASRLYVVETSDGKEVLIPDIKQFIKEINVEEGVFITPIPGFFTDI